MKLSLIGECWREMRRHEDRDERFGASERSRRYITRFLVANDMNAKRTRCGHCGFVVPAGEECPLCEQELKTAGFPANALQALFEN